MVLVDGHRKTCHTLVLNYLVVGGGFRAFLDQFQSVILWMWKMKESLAPVEHLLKQLPEEWAGGMITAPSCVNDLHSGFGTAQENVKSASQLAQI